MLRQLYWKCMTVTYFHSRMLHINWKMPHTRFTQYSTNGSMDIILTALWCLSAESKAATDGIDSNLEQTRTIIASLQTAVDFVKVLSESLAVLTQLLASSTMTDVQESITLVIYCHKFQVLLSLS